MSEAPWPPRAELAGLAIADGPALWSALGFTVRDGTTVIGGIEVTLGAAGRGITGWTLRHVPDGVQLDGLATEVTVAAPPPAPSHANGAIAIDQVVIATPDFDRTAAALDAANMPLRRVSDAGGSRQGFRRLGPAILELVEAREGPPGPARFWGLVVIVPELARLRDHLSPLVGEIRDAVQPGRHIAALSRDAGLSVRVAFMDPE
ncbi:MAG TPA: hypothetical protein VIJ83_03635 [Solirubrobacteraceae bacterium]